MLALDPGTGEKTVLSVPDPQGFFARGLDGRVDDPAAGWQGKGVRPGIVKFTMRPDPLANDLLRLQTERVRTEPKSVRGRDRSRERPLST